MSAMVAKKYTLELTNADGTTGCDNCDLWIAPELLSKEPLGAAVRDMDSDWKDVVTWVWYGMVTAEEMGLHSGNYAAADMTNPSIDRLLNNNLGLGTDTNPLPATWMQNVLSAVGNYGEAWDDSFCDGTWDADVGGSDTMNNCVLSRVGTANALVSEGGLQFAPPLR
jgi:general L-amino acid transport system substrate-binding protein